MSTAGQDAPERFTGSYGTGAIRTLVGHQWAKHPAQSAKADYRACMGPVFSSPARRFAAAIALLGATALGPGAGLSFADDASDYDGTKCSPEQFFDATTQRCSPELVTNDPQGEPQPQDVGANYDGTKCDPGQFYDATDASCALDAVTNDPQMAETLENGDPVDSNLPVGGAL